MWLHGRFPHQRDVLCMTLKDMEKAREWMRQQKKLKKYVDIVLWTNFLPLRNFLFDFGAGYDTSDRIRVRVRPIRLILFCRRSIVDSLLCHSR